MSNSGIPPAAQVDPSEGPFDEAQASEQENFEVAEGQDPAAHDGADTSGAIMAE